MPIWAEVFATYTDLRPVVLDPKNRGDFLRRLLVGDGDVFILHWDVLRIIGDALRHQYWFHIIADEVHRAKNRKAQQTRALKSLRAAFKTGLSGTPATNKPYDLWSVLDWLYPKPFGRSFWQFYERYCNPPEAPVLMANGTWKQIGHIVPGDYVMGWQRSESSGRRQLVESKVVRVDTRKASLVTVRLASGRSLRCTPDHLWVSARSHGTERYVSVYGNKKGPLRNASLLHAFEPPRTLTFEEQRDADWLGGILDGEGNFTGASISIFQSPEHNPEVYNKLKRVLTNLGIPYIEPEFGKVQLNRPNARSAKDRRQISLNLLSWCTLAKADQMLQYVLGSQNWGTSDEVVGVEPSVDNATVISMQTTTGNYIAWGYASKNCDFAIEYPQGYRQFRGTMNVQELKDKMSPFYVRRLKQDVLEDLPDKYYTTIWVDLDPKQRRAYDQMRKEMVAWLETQGDDTPLVAPVVIAQLVRLQQLSVAYAEVTVSPQDGSTVVLLTDPPSTKLDALMQLIEDNPDEPIVIFSQFKQLINLAIARLARSNIDCVYITGDVAQADRHLAVKRFQSNEVHVFLGTIGAGGEGITLTAASTVVFLDRDWSPARNAQAEDRLHRIGQKNAVQVIDIAASRTIDVRKRGQLEMKKKWLNEILNP